MGSTCGSTRRELWFYHRCPRGFSSCKVIVKRFFLFPSPRSRSYHPLLCPFSVDVIPPSFFFHACSPFRAREYVHLSPLQADSFSLARFFLPLFLHFLPANLSCRLVLRSSTRLVFTSPLSFASTEDISHVHLDCFACFSVVPFANTIYQRRSLNDILLFTLCWHYDRFMKFASGRDRNI